MTVLSAVCSCELYVFYWRIQRSCISRFIYIMPFQLCIYMSLPVPQLLTGCCRLMLIRQLQLPRLHLRYVHLGGNWMHLHEGNSSTRYKIWNYITFHYVLLFLFSILLWEFYMYMKCPVTDLIQHYRQLERILSRMSCYGKPPLIRN